MGEKFRSRRRRLGSPKQLQAEKGTDCRQTQGNPDSDWLVSSSDRHAVIPFSRVVLVSRQAFGENRPCIIVLTAGVNSRADRSGEA
jgi:hypothetical protein